jgi:hypothetical protein
MDELRDPFRRPLSPRHEAHPPAADDRMPFGKYKGIRLAEVPTD